MEKVAKRSTQSSHPPPPTFKSFQWCHFERKIKQEMNKEESCRNHWIKLDFTFIPRKKKQFETIQNVSELCLMIICIIRFWGGYSSQSFSICRLRKACFQCRARYQEETIKGKEQAFKLGPFDCVTDWFQVRQLWEPQPEENCPSVQRSWEAGRLHGWHGSPEFQYYSRLVGFLWDLHWASRILLWLIAATLKAKSGQRRRGHRVSGLLNSYNYQHNARDMPSIPSEDTSWA